MRKILFVTSFISAMIFTVLSCSKSNDGGSNSIDCTGVAKTWSADVSVIIQTFCNQAGCHDAGSTNEIGPLTNHAQVFAVRFRIRDAVDKGRMPQNANLSAAQKNTVLCWIDSGAPNN